MLKALFLLFEELLEKLRNLEEKGRELSSKRDDIVAFEDSNYFIDVRYTVDNIREFAEDFKIIFDEKILKFAREISSAIESILRYSDKCLREGLLKKQCEIPSEILDEVDEAAKELFGARCTWLRREVHPYTLSATENDISACIHRLIEKLEPITEDYEIKGKCAFSKKVPPSEKIKEACIAWSETTDRLNGKGLYVYDDYFKLNCFAIGSKMECRVGFFGGHRTHLDFEKGRIEYYDEDRDVCDAMKMLWKKVGLECEDTPFGVTCSGLDEEKYEPAMKVLAAATSMDLRMREPWQFWGRNLSSPEEEVKRILEELNFSP